MVNEMEKMITDLKNIIEEKENNFENERKEYVDRINKIINDKEAEIEELKKKYNEELKQQKDLIEKYKSDRFSNVKRAKKFLGLKVISDGFFIKDQSNVISYESLEDGNKDSKEDKDNIINQDFSCILCCIRVRNIFFDNCHHCCICEQCLEKCYYKLNRKTNQKEYFCPICNNNTEKGEQNSYTESKKIIYV